LQEKNINTKIKNKEGLLLAGNEVGVEVNAEKTKYMSMFYEQNAGKSHDIRHVTNPLKIWQSSNIWQQF
jgi:hypothetical protein